MIIRIIRRCRPAPALCGCHDFGAKSRGNRLVLGVSRLPKTKVGPMRRPIIAADCERRPIIAPSEPLCCYFADVNFRLFVRPFFSGRSSWQLELKADHWRPNRRQKQSAALPAGAVCFGHFRRPLVCSWSIIDRQRRRRHLFACRPAAN